MKKFPLVLVLVMSLFSVTFAEEESDFSAEIEQSYMGKYVWRGIQFNDDPVNQGAITLSYRGLSLNVWYNYELSDENDQQNDVTEVDYTLSYGLEFEQVDVELGFIYYDFPKATSETSTREVYASVSLKKVFLSPTISAYYDMGTANGWYLSLGFSHEFEVNLGDFKQPVEVGVTFGGNSKNNWRKYLNETTTDEESDGLSDVTVSVSRQGVKSSKQTGNKTQGGRLK